MNFAMLFFARESRLLGARATLLLLSVLSTMGCQAILGIEKAEHDPSLTSGDGDDTSTPGDGDGDDTDVPGDGDGDTAVTGDGDTTAVGDGDGDGDEPVPVAGVPGAYFAAESCSTEVDVSAEDLISCLYRVSCDPTTPLFSITSCITFDYMHASTAEACSNGVTSCSEVYACIHRAPSTSDQLASCEENIHCDGICTGTCDGYCDYTYESEGYTLCDGSCDGTCVGLCDDSVVSKKWSCDGDEAINCSSAGPTLDCAGLGGSCRESLTSSPSADGGCLPNSVGDAAQEACAAGDDATPHCDGDLYYWCADGTVWGAQCEYGCVEGTSGAYCANTTETCDALGTSTCSGDDLHFCNQDGGLFVHACGQNDLSCDDENGDCVADGCSSSACTEGCLDDQTLTVCIGGAQIEIDCTQYGFNGCVEETYSGYPYARCSLDSPP